MSELESMQCTKCKEIKPLSEYWFDNRRDKHQTPCKDCRNLYKRMRRREMYINGRFSKNDINKSLRLKGLPNDIIEVVKANILLNREIDKLKEVQVTGNEEAIIIYCPLCGDNEVLKSPVKVNHLNEIGELFNKRHYECRKK